MTLLLILASTVAVPLATLFATTVALLARDPRRREDAVHVLRLLLTRTNGRRDGDTEIQDEEVQRDED